MLWKLASQVHYFDPEPLPWAKLLRDNYKEIRREWEAFERFLNSGDRDGVARFRNRNNMAVEEGWKNVYLMNMGNIDELAAQHMPRTLELVAQTPLMSAMISILPPHGHIRMHRGEYKGIWRYHLALEGPSETAEEPLAWGDVVPPTVAGKCGPQKFRVTREEKAAGNVSHECSALPTAHLGVYLPAENPVSAFHVDRVQIHAHVEGRDLLFDDTYIHFANNTGSARRVVLFCDTLREDLSIWLFPFLWTAAWLIGPHLAFTRDYLEVHRAALERIGLSTQITPWYLQTTWLRLKYLAPLSTWAAGYPGETSGGAAQLLGSWLISGSGGEL